MENEMRSQLRRQAAAHSDHIQDVLEVQQTELGRHHARVVDETVTAEKSAHKQVIVGAKPRGERSDEKYIIVSFKLLLFLLSECFDVKRNWPDLFC